MKKRILRVWLGHGPKHIALYDYAIRKGADYIFQTDSDGQTSPDEFEALYNLPNVMLTTFFVYYNENVIFKNVTFNPRQAGTNSINARKIIAIGWKALGDFRSFKKTM